MKFLRVYNQGFGSESRRNIKDKYDGGIISIKTAIYHPLSNCRVAKTFKEALAPDSFFDKMPEVESHSSLVTMREKHTIKNGRDWRSEYSRQ